MEKKILFHDEIAEILKENGPAVVMAIYNQSKQIEIATISCEYNHAICEAIYTHLENGMSVYINGRNIYECF